MVAHYSSIVTHCVNMVLPSSHRKLPIREIKLDKVLSELDVDQKQVRSESIHLLYYHIVGYFQGKIIELAYYSKFLRGKGDFHISRALICSLVNILRVKFS